MQKRFKKSDTMSLIFKWLVFCNTGAKTRNMYPMKSSMHSPLNFDQLFEELLSPRRIHNKNAIVRPAARILETQAGFEIELLAPGFSKADLSMTLHGDQLVVKGQCKPGTRDAETKTWLSEFQFSDFERSFQLPESIDVEHIEAEVKEGILCIKLPKKPELQAPQTRQIPVS